MKAKHLGIIILIGVCSGILAAVITKVLGRNFDHYAIGASAAFASVVSVMYLASKKEEKNDPALKER
ncbi:hypothetical protein VDG1235_1430 [Verrucomicrobiia bacterium DG1235]|nr:hypothetical protein VDG1235_1430 [Verrucomicrobiae bacterium DG1235]